MGSLLFGGLLAGIPVVVHLLHRQKTTPIEWGAMQFLLETPLTVRRRQRIDNWLLLLVRMGILLVLVAMLARPLVPRQGVATAPPVDVGIVIDHSLSMGRRGAGGGTLFDGAVNAAEAVAKMLPPSASVSVVLAEHSPRTVTPTPVAVKASVTGGPGGAWGQVLAGLRQTKPGTTDANVAEAVRTAMELVAHGRNTRKMVLVCSDDQRTNWAIGDEGAWKLALGDREGAGAPGTPGVVPVYSLPLAVGSEGNLSVKAITVEPGFIGVHRPAVVSATVGNTGGGDLATAGLRLVVDGRVLGRQAVGPLTPGQSTAVRFDTFFPEAGSHWVRVESDVSDALAADNAVTAAVTVSPRLNVLVVDGRLTPSGNYSAAAYLDAAMQPVDPSIDPTAMVLPKVISVSEVEKERFEDYAVVVLNDVPRLPAGEIARLTDYAQKGNGLWVILGPRTEPSFVGALSKTALLPAEVGAKPVAVAEGQQAGIDVKEPENPAVAVITASEQNAFALVAMRQWWPVKPTPTAGMHTVLATTTGDAIATEMDLGKSGGRVVVWTSPVNGTWNFLHTSPVVVPLVQETLFHLASGSAGDTVRQADAGQTLVWSGPLSPAVESAKALLPDGTSKPLTVQLRGEKYVTSFNDTFLPGLYEMRFVPASVPQPVYYSVNIDRQELDFTSLAAADVKWLEDKGIIKDRITAETVPQALEAMAGGVELWGLLGFLVLALLVVEVAITRNLAKEAQIVPERGHADVTASRMAALVQGERR
jgi:hypothetical protein